MIELWHKTVDIKIRCNKENWVIARRSMKRKWSSWA